MDSFIEDLKDEDDNVRSHAIHSLGQIGDEKAVEPLIQVMNDENERIDVRRHATSVLGQIGDGRAVKPLIQILESKDDNSVRMVAIRALTGIGDGRAVEPLIQAMDDKNESVRNHAAYALVQFGESAVEPLIQLMNDENETIEVRNHAAETLSRIKDGRVVEPFVETLKEDDNNTRIQESLKEND
ncbi:HEAT repeat domain-containing protein [Methanococcoides sp. SA1]|nr:HEAT repeat domain-containing protein [Methanococcoides sp. SA1]